MWWSNLSLSEARKAIDLVKSLFIFESFNSAEYLLPSSFSGVLKKNNSVHLLPAFDEFLISYRDRSSSLSKVHNKKTITDNGIFYPIIVVNGQVSGVWKRTIQKNKINIETDLYYPVNKQINNILAKKVKLFGKFLDMETEIRSKSL
jgi:hypothetical protein